MIKKYENAAGISVFLGLILFGLGMFIAVKNSGALSNDSMLALAGLAVMLSIFGTGILGGMFYAKAKGYTPLFCLLGYVAFFILLFLPDKTKNKI